MLDKLIDVFEVLTPEARLIVILNDLKTYNDLRKLTELVKSGASMSSSSTRDSDSLIETIVD